MKSVLKTGWLALALACALVAQAQGQQLISNGGFETGFSAWTRANRIGSEGNWWQQSGSTSPVNGFAVPAPPGGTSAAMTDAAGPGSHVLYQDFVVPFTLGVSTLRFDLYIQNRASAFFSPATLDFATPTLNQQFRVDILTTTSDPFSVTVGDVLMNVYQTQPGNPLVSGWVTITVDLTALLASRAGETLRLRFAEVDNVNTLIVGVDNVSLVVPEPATVTLLLGGLGLLGGAALRKRRRSLR
jgi:hypothetical protein